MPSVQPQTETPERERRLPLSGMSGVGRVWALNICITGLAAAVYVLFVHRLEGPGASFTIPWWGMAALFYLDEICVVHLKFKRDAYSFSLAEIPLVIGFFFATPQALVVGQILGALFALGLHRKQSILKLFFNTSHYTLEACLAVLIFHGLGGGSPVAGVGIWLIAIAATFTASYLSVFMVALAISLSEGSPRYDTLPKGLAYATVGTTTTTSLALLGATVIWYNPRAAVLLVVPAALLYLAYRAYMDQMDKRESVEFLYESTRLTQSYLEVDAALMALLQQTREMFRAEVAQVTLFPDQEGGPARRTGIGPGDEQQSLHEVRLDPREGVWARVAAEEKAVLLPRPMINARLKEHFMDRQIFKDVMVAPLFGGEKVVGTLVVGDRLGDVSTFDDEDLKLFETLANHASVTLENARLVDRLRDSLAHLTEMNRLKDDFVAAVSHELRTPLTSIQGYVKTLLRPGVEFSTDQRQAFLEAVERQSERLRNLIEDLLVVSRLEAHQVSATVARVTLPDVMESVVGELGHRITTHDINLDLAPDLPLMQTDEGKLHQIMSNLIDNACKYSPEGSVVRVKGRTDGEGVLISVSDQGEGVPPDAEEKIFERFYQADQSSTRPAGGTGLGLYICRRLADALGGRVWIERTGPEGSIFSLWIPTVLPLSGEPYMGHAPVG